MTSEKKLRVAVVYGGRSGEHEVSLQSAASVLRHLDPNRYEIIPIAIDKQGLWRYNDLSVIEAGSGERALPVFRDAPTVALPAAQDPESGDAQLIPAPGPQGAKTLGEPLGVDVIFPVIHGPPYEDGALQGLLELAGVPYVGAGVLGSAVGMDKEIAKRLVASQGIPVVPYLVGHSRYWQKSRPLAELAKQVEEELGFPVFVKPANAGSSVGVHKAEDEKSLGEALDDSFRYDEKVLIEKAINGREIELAVLENRDDLAEPLVSVPGEVAPSHEFYSYEAKYLDENGAELMIPAQLEASQVEVAQELASRIFLALDCEGMARVDLFLEKETGQFYLNEINTLPGFTSISMYPKLWEASGTPYSELLTQLIDLALDRHKRRSKLKRDFNL